MDMLRDYQRVVLVKGGQCGGSEAARNVLGFWIDEDPGPVIVVMPDKDSAKEMLTERVKPMVKNTPRLRDYITDEVRDLTRLELKLRTCTIHIGWSGSAQSLSTRPARYVVFDEVDKFARWSGREGSPIELGRKRLETYGDRAREFMLSTPTTRDGNIWTEYEACALKVFYFVPCPRCGRYQRLVFAQLKWEKVEGEENRDAGDRIEREEGAWYECEGCQARLLEKDKPAMLSAGVWARAAGDVGNGALLAPLPRSKSIGLHISGLYSPWITWARGAGEFLKAIGNLSTMMSWRNLYCGEPYEVLAAVVKPSELQAKRAAGFAPRLAPAWTRIVIATADSQMDYYRFVVRAWGRAPSGGPRSRLLSYGRAETGEQLKAMALTASYPVEGCGATARPYMLFADAGGGSKNEESENITQRVYLLARTNPRIVPLHGHGGSRRMPEVMRMISREYVPPGQAKPITVKYLRIDVNHFKTVLAKDLATKDGDEDIWQIHSAADEVYCREMTGEHKVLLRKGRGQEFAWVPVSPGAPTHYWDCEVYQRAAADWLHADEWMKISEAAAARPPRQSRGTGNEGGGRIRTHY
jgi:phage terminase large subunit GpA-like protein